MMVWMMVGMKVRMKVGKEVQIIFADVTFVSDDD